MPTRIYIAAIIGTGGIAGAHVRGLRSLGDRIDLAAAADVDAARLGKFADEHDIAGRYADADTMLAAVKPDLVCICTPPITHAPLSIAAMRAGAHVLCEKPLCASLAELDQVQAVERATGRTCSSVFQWRFGSGAMHVKRLLDAGELGRPLVGVCHTLWYRDAKYYAVPWRGKWRTELGGPTMGHGIHAMDLFLHLLGDFDEVRAMTGTLDRAIEVEDVSLALVRFRSGALGSVVNSVLSPRQESYVRLDTQRATVELTHLYSHRNEHWRVSVPGSLEPPAGWREMGEDAESTHAAQMAAMIHSLDRDEPPLVTGREARRTLELITCLYKAAATGQPVTQGSIRPGDPYHTHVGGQPITTP